MANRLPQSKGAAKSELIPVGMKVNALIGETMYSGLGQA